MVVPETTRRNVYDLIIIGGGVVGLAILREATLYGWSCILVEKEPDLLTWASGSNSGILCTGVDAAEGTLERALIRDSISRVRSYCEKMNVPTRPCGSLVCQWPWDQNGETSLQAVLAESHEAGDSHANLLTADEIQKLEPNLNASCLGGVHIPGEIVVDPWLFAISLAVDARHNGARIVTGFSFDPEKSKFENGLWEVHREARGDTNGVPRVLSGRAVVSAAGLWADKMHQQSNNLRKPAFVSKPRRGQYGVYSSSASNLIQHPIQPIPTQRTKGIFVFSTLYDQIVVGPTASVQSSFTDRGVDALVAEELNELLLRIIPTDISNKVGEYVGIRPGTNHRDYQVHVDFSNRWITVAGIRSTGLTASLGIGRHARALLQHLMGSGPPRGHHDSRRVKLPDISDLVADFHNRGDGTVVIDDFSYKVTHPLTILGWNARTGIANVLHSQHEVV